MKSLAIEREYGTGGWEMGKKIAYDKKIAFYDENRIIEEAGKLGYELALLVDYEEKEKESILYNIAMIAKRQDDFRINVGKKVTQLLFEMKDTVEKLLVKEPAVFIGLGVSGIIDSNSLVKVYLKASRGRDRLNKIKEINPEYSIKDIEQLLTRKDAQRRIYYQCLTKKEWADSSNYDCVYDISSMSQDSICKSIMQEMGR